MRIGVDLGGSKTEIIVLGQEPTFANGHDLTDCSYAELIHGAG